MLSDYKGEILKSVIIVIIVKGIVSPHTPVTAYIAVIMQALLGTTLLYFRNMYHITSFLFSILVSLLSALQKVLVLTIVFGANFWNAIDDFFNYLIYGFFNIKAGIYASYWIVGFYFLIHALGGLAVGIYVSGFKRRIEQRKRQQQKIIIANNLPDEILYFKTRTRKSWWLKKSRITLFIFLVILILISYISPGVLNINADSVIFMMVRSFIVIFVWMYFLSPVILRFSKIFLKKRETNYSKDIKAINEIIPDLKKIIFYFWKKSAEQKGLKRVYFFVNESVLYILLNE